MNCVNLFKLLLLARAIYDKFFKSFVPVKMLGLLPLLAFMGGTQLRKKFSGK